MVDAKTVFVYFVRVIKVIAVLTLLLYGAALGMLARSAVDSITLDDQGKAFAVLSYAGYMLFVVILVIAEFGFKWFERGVHVLHFWAGRGVLLGWLGIQSNNQGEQMVAVVAGAQSTINPNTLRTLNEVVGWSLISIGVLYILMSVMCLQKLTGGKTMEELDAGFVGVAGDGSQAAAEDGRAGQYSSSNLAAPLNSTLDDEDIKLIQNTATALGMTVRELRNRFSGSSGSREAQKFFDDRKAQLQAAKAQPPPPGGNPNEKPRERGESNANLTKQQSATAPPASGRFEQGAFDDDPKSRRLQEDEDLEAMYYAQHSTQ